MARTSIGPRALRDVINAINSLSNSDRPHFSYGDISQISTYSPRAVAACVSFLEKRGDVKRCRVSVPDKRGGPYFRYELHIETLQKLELTNAA